MSNTVAVRFVESAGNLPSVLEHLVQLEAAPFAVRAASDSPSRYSITMKSTPFLLADVVERADVGMIEAGNNLASRSKRWRRAWLSAREIRGQDLDGDGPLQARVSRAIHFAHAASAQRREDFVGT